MKKQLISLSPSGSGGGGGGGARKYLHRIYMRLSISTTNVITVSFDLVSSDNTPIPDVPTLCGILRSVPKIKVKYGEEYEKNAICPVSSSTCMKPLSGGNFESGSEFIPAFLTFYESTESDIRFYLYGARVRSGNTQALANVQVQIIKYSSVNNTIDTVAVQFTPSITDQIIEL